MRTAIYGRVSTEGRGQDSENQMVQLRAFALAMHWEITAEYIDNVSASGKKERPAFKKLFADASKRKFDIVLFWSLDRFSREGVRETLNHLTKLDSWGVGFRSYSEQYLDSTGIFKDAVIAILAAIAKQERIRISERTKAGLDRVRAAGQKLGRRYRQFDVDHARRLMTADGASYRKVALQVGVSVAVLHRAMKETTC
jgi:DNA invertase Pin-like site-specific DNA recombinase